MNKSVEIRTIAENVDLVTIDGKEIVLVGTAHVSESSAKLVEEMILEHRPDTVCVELCAPRYESLKQADRWKDTDLFNVIREGRAYVLLVQLVLASFQKRLAQQFGVRPGEEMRRALEIAERERLRVELVDREIRTTLKRAWAKAGFWSMTKITAALVSSIFSKEEISEREIEELKRGDTLSAMLSELSQFLPGVSTALIDERDLYMAAKIQDAPGAKVLAVLGAGHVPGIKDTLGTTINIKELEEIPPGSRWGVALTWGLPLLIVGMIVYGFFSAGTETTVEMVWSWVLITGLLSALGALIALGHPLTILSAFVAAPFTTLHPAIAAGWVSGLVEAVVRKPRVRDLETIVEDVGTVRGIWSNRVSRVLLVMVLSNLGSALGAIVGSIKLASLLQ